MAQVIGDVALAELLKKLTALSGKALRCRGDAGNLVTMIGDIQPIIYEIQHSGVVLRFLTGSYDAGFGAILRESIGQTQKKLVILDDVWTRESLDQLMFKIPGTTTLVVSRSKLADPKRTYNVELLNVDEATSLFCLSAFDHKSVPSGFNKDLVKQVVKECKGLPLALKVVDASLKNQTEKYWEGVVKKLSRGEPADETHERRVIAQIEANQRMFLGYGCFP
ncbi:unnamed protein product [Arabis nemorensis]|uniref:NB-ARC domain-containing protein n=1 Tax=Arabis nemorensis TaxID=586526 RepID=A0A565BVP1_9BRAS|nr:unnamed protein product [Arabis nemorensis]